MCVCVLTENSICVMFYSLAVDHCMVDPYVCVCVCVLTDNSICVMFYSLAVDHRICYFNRVCVCVCVCVCVN